MKIIFLALFWESLIETYSQLYRVGGGILKNVKDFSIDLWRAMYVIWDGFHFRRLNITLSKYEFDE